MEQEIDKHIFLEKLITGCKKGNVIQQELLYKHFYGYSLSICRLYTYSNDDAVSILNDSFLKVFSSIQKKGYNDTVPFKNWLRRILINTAIDNIRKNSKHYYQLEIEEVEDLIPDENSIDNLNVEDILKLLDQLPEMHRLVFNLYEIQGFSHLEISVKLVISESTSRVFLTRAKKKLRVLFNKNF
ncbi:RNA polymerase sigma factor [Lutibacter flavus]|uniref:RNA polymerase sigma-70 factor, ECF subfamily n=1 Tax=Lutibacter flavus TaxID=691689 RepID=A0A238VPR1_9FLAO|nr:RNA polymerase sigma factor [Lutibacter flavus]SNR36198.1 RNA polymerase sigma-70 factor, ECF subfamily [Lutibacter flavus]